MIEIQAMFPMMVTPKLHAIQDYYHSVFGFNTVFYQEGFYLHLVQPSSGVQLGFLHPNHPSQPDFLQSQMEQDGYVITLEVEDARAAYTYAQTQELDISLHYKEEQWGQRHFILQDPAGIKIDVVEHFQI
ncbi:hypothetical protein N473_21800 [Pseudoalteromonas luteoviolacea CPMOR-1]|uniref:Glyoxalase/fosfomycin resistance/dioxygenase domain-containing protein n=1 Tax=Pseudoalteromonas luteoviolacea CPMOR-1 TaxID=1365248 RepID=A0A167JXZ6_9GAMM|nr:VOC family protein [Pseudoalteromonas luteoviolacea]KZN61825.1 hypothetical protein N473_21800 [Pseudoalteromonas luteoviolacea CPMOR-1]